MCGSLKYKTVVDKLLETSGIQKHEKVLKDGDIAHILVYEHLFGKGLHGDGKYKVSVNVFNDNATEVKMYWVAGAIIMYYCMYMYLFIIYYMYLDYSN